MDPGILILFAGLAGMVIIAIVLASIAASVVCLSALISLWSKSARLGWQVLFLQSGLILGSLAGALCSWLACGIYWDVSPDWTLLMIGVSLGAGTGLGLACVAFSAAALVMGNIWPPLWQKVIVVSRRAGRCFGNPQFA